MILKYPRDDNGFEVERSKVKVTGSEKNCRNTLGSPGSGL